MKLQNPMMFFAAVRRGLGGLTQGKVDGINALLEAVPAKDFIPEHLAYELATMHWETGGKMLPVVENLNYTTAAQIRKTWPTRFKTTAAAQPYTKNPQKLANFVYANRMGNGSVASGEGWKFRGRGGPQVTGKSNYAWGGKYAGVDLLAEPDRLLDPKISAAVMHEGMKNGRFTGLKLKDFLPKDPIGARKIINPDRNGPQVAALYNVYLKAIQDGGGAAVEGPQRTYLMSVLEDGRIIETYPVDENGKRI